MRRRSCRAGCRSFVPEFLHEPTREPDKHHDQEDRDETEEGHKGPEEHFERIHQCSPFRFRLASSTAINSDFFQRGLMILSSLSAIAKS